MKEQDTACVETYPEDTWWRNRIGSTVLVGKYVDRPSAARAGASEARARGLDHVVTFTGSRRLRLVRERQNPGPLAVTQGSRDSSSGRPLPDGPEHRDHAPFRFRSGQSVGEEAHH